MGCLRNYTVPPASPLHHSLCLSFTVPSTRASCLNYAGSHLYSHLGNCGSLGILLHARSSFADLGYCRCFYGSFCGSFYGGCCGYCSGYCCRYCGYCRSDITNIAVETGRRVQGVTGVSYNSNTGTSLSGPAESLIALTAICKVSSLIVLLAILLYTLLPRLYRSNCLPLISFSFTYPSWYPL
jgi:hypothetical protein